MQVLNRLKTYASARFCDETGGITVDWVVLTAAVAGLIAALFYAIGNDTADYGGRIGDAMSDKGIKTSF